MKEAVVDSQSEEPKLPDVEVLASAAATIAAAFEEEKKEPSRSALSPFFSNFLSGGAGAAANQE